MNYNFIYYFFVVSLLPLYSCIGQQKDPFISHASSSDTIIKDIPLDFQQSYRTQLKRKVEPLLHLSSIENGYNGFELRIWRGYALKDTDQLIVIKDTLSTWSAKLINVGYKNLSEKNLELLSISADEVQKEPKSGWKKFVNELYDLDIFELPDYKSIPNYPIHMDPGGVTIEFANSKKYKIFSYPEPEFAREIIPEAKRVFNLLKLIEDEFGYKGFAMRSEQL